MKRGTLAALAEAACAWGVCYALIKTRFFEPKAVPRSQLMALAATFALSLLGSQITKEWSRGEAEQVGRLLLPSIQVNIRAGEMPPEEDNGVSYLKIPLNQL